MFRMLKLEPPHGWRAVLWELAIVTVGVLIALVAQQWVEDRSWQSKARSGSEAIRDELAFHHLVSVEWRVAEPCIIAQIDRLKKRVLASGARLSPAPVYSEPGFDFYVLRMPNRDYDDGAWQAAISDGVSSRLERNMRRELNSHYAKTRRLVELTAQNNRDYQRLLILSEPLPLDPDVRFSMLQTLNELRGRVELMGHLSGQLIDHITKAGMKPRAADVRSAVLTFGTPQFCRAQGYPVRLPSAAEKPISN